MPTNYLCASSRNRRASLAPGGLAGPDMSVIDWAIIGLVIARNDSNSCSADDGRPVTFAVCKCNRETLYVQIGFADII